MTPASSDNLLVHLEMGLKPRPPDHIPVQATHMEQEIITQASLHVVRPTIFHGRGLHQACFIFCF